MELYLAEEGKAKLGDHQIELIKRDSKGPGGDVAKTAVQELIVREKVSLLTGFVFSPNIIASAPLIQQAKVPTLILNAATAWIPSLSPYLARVSMTMWQTSYPMGQYAFQKLDCKTAAVGYTDYPARQGRARGVQDRLRAGGRPGRRHRADGRPGGGPRLHAVHAAGQGREAGLLLRVRAGRQSRLGALQDLCRARHEGCGRAPDRPGRHRPGHRSSRAWATSRSA